jgi:structural maintenance of chromosome 4
MKPNLDILEEYKKKDEEYMARVKDLDEVTAKRDAEKDNYDALRKSRLDEFMAGFNTISLKLKEMYQVWRAGLCDVKLTIVLVDDYYRRQCRIRAGG